MKDEGIIGRTVNKPPISSTERRVAMEMRAQAT